MRGIPTLVVAAVLALSGCIFVKVPLVPEISGVEERTVEGSGRAKIVVTEISGLLALSSFSLTGMGKAPPVVPRLREDLEAAMADPRVVGLVVRIDSSGGSVTASDILYHELKTFAARKGVPVVACVMDRAFSGGYYAALAADEIWAHPTSAVGGVGVISFKLDLSGLLGKWGVEVETVKSGEWKDFWSPLRPSRPEEREVMQGITDRLHSRFLDLVRESRPVEPQALELVSRGGVFDAKKALEMKLIDRIGYLEEAVDRVRELAGVSEARVILYRRPGSYGANIYAAQPPLLQGLSLAEQGFTEALTPAFGYLFLP